MRCLIACEQSGIVRTAFKSQGWDAWSCDLMESEIEGQHYQGDVLDVLTQHWDLVIAHPPCTSLSVSGRWYWNNYPKETQEALDFFKVFLDLDVKHVAIENPVGIVSTRLQKATQYVQPWQFGHDASKKTGLWLKNLPKLVPTDVIIKDRYANQTPSGQNNLGPGPERAKMRSKTYEGIANAMADQWTEYIKQC